MAAVHVDSESAKHGGDSCSLWGLPVLGVFDRRLQGRWSKQWELRDSSQCTICPTGVVCPIDGMSNPCSVADFPLPFTPFENVPKLMISPAPHSSRQQCMSLNSQDFADDVRYQQYFWGFLDPNRSYAIDPTGAGPYLIEVGDGVANASCFYNERPYGTPVYQRFRDYYGKLFEMQYGHKSQGYGNASYLGYFNFGSLYLRLPEYTTFSPAHNCTPGYFNYNKTVGTTVWYPGTCEADIVCNIETKSEATSCSEGYVCDENTNALDAQAIPCPPGFVCDFGTTPDISLYAPFGKYQFLCPSGYMCRAGTPFSLRRQRQCLEVTLLARE